MIIFVQIIRKRLTMRDKVVIVTGASSGIGKALVYELARQKAKIAIASRNIEELLRIEEDLRHGHSSCTDGCHQGNCL